MGLSLKPTTSEDHPAVMTLFEEMLREAGQYPDESRLCTGVRKLLANPIDFGNLFCNLAMVDQTVAGFTAGVVHWDDLLGIPYVCLRYLYVHERFRRKRIGEGCVRKFRIESPGLGFRALVNWKNVPGLALSSNLGFSHQEFRLFTKPMTDRDIMALRSRIQYRNNRHCLSHTTSTGEEYLVELATEATLEDIVAFNRALALEILSCDCAPKGIRRAVKETMRRSAVLTITGRFVVVTRNGEPVAAIKVVPEFVPTNNSWLAYLRRFYIREDCRGRGLFRALLDGAIALCCPRGTEELRSFVQYGSSGAIQTAVHALETYGFSAADDWLLVEASDLLLHPPYGSSRTK